MTERRPRTGKSALFSGSGADDHGPAPRARRDAPPSDRRVLFSEGAGEGHPVTISCRACGAHTPVSLAEATRRVLRPGALWWPLRRHPHRIACPACGAMAWCRLGWRQAATRGRTAR